MLRQHARTGVTITGYGCCSRRVIDAAPGVISFSASETFKRLRLCGEVILIRARCLRTNNIHLFLSLVLCELAWSQKRAAGTNG